MSKMIEEKDQKQKFDIKDIKEIYTSLSVAKKEIWRRWNDDNLKKKVEKFIGGAPKPFLKKPRIVLFRHIMTPDTEFMRFLELAKWLKLKPLGWEYHDDFFTTRNPDKLRLGKLCFFNGLNKKGEDIIYYKKIIDISESEGKKFNQIKTFQGESLIDFHHRMLQLTNLQIENVDFSNWIQKNGAKAKNYYEKYLALFLCYGILTENFLLSGSEKIFSKGIFLPAYKKIVNNFNIKPIILPAIPNEEITKKYWWCYSRGLDKKY